MTSKSVEQFKQGIHEFDRRQTNRQTDRPCYGNVYRAESLAL